MARRYRNRRKGGKNKLAEEEQGIEIDENPVLPTSVKLMVFDCDGTLTDGQLQYGSEGVVSRRFCVQDGFGIASLAKAGIKTAILTAKNSPEIKARAKELGIQSVMMGVSDKQAGFIKLAEHHGVALKEMGYMGDDLPDVPAINLAGWAAAPLNARTEVIERVDYVTQATAGAGAAREVCEAILISQGYWPPFPLD